MGKKEHINNTLAFLRLHLLSRKLLFSLVNATADKNLKKVVLLFLETNEDTNYNPENHKSYYGSGKCGSG